MTYENKNKIKFLKYTPGDIDFYFNRVFNLLNFSLNSIFANNFEI